MVDEAVAKEEEEAGEMGLVEDRDGDNGVTAGR